MFALGPGGIASGSKEMDSLSIPVGRGRGKGAVVVRGWLWVYRDQNSGPPILSPISQFIPIASQGPRLASHQIFLLKNVLF